MYGPIYIYELYMNIHTCFYTRTSIDLSSSWIPLKKILYLNMSREVGELFFHLF